MGDINGLPVYAPSDIPNLILSSRRITDVLLAVPSASRARQKEILVTLSDLLLHVRTLPGLSTLANGGVKVEHIRDVEIEDLLGREPVQANENLLQQNITSKVVMVSGAGGSIGSELCRQYSELFKGAHVWGLDVASIPFFMPHENDLSIEWQNNPEAVLKLLHQFAAHMYFRENFNDFKCKIRVMMTSWLFLQ